jgi:hypothetical protein
MLFQWLASVISESCFQNSNMLRFEPASSDTMISGCPTSSLIATGEISLLEVYKSLRSSYLRGYSCKEDKNNKSIIYCD